MNDIKMTEIINNYINGNISDFKKQVARLSKRDFLELILVMQTDYDVTRILNIL